MGNEKRALLIHEIKETEKEATKTDEQGMVSERQGRIGRGCVRKRKTIELKKAQIRWLHHLASKCLNYDKAVVKGRESSPTTVLSL